MANAHFSGSELTPRHIVAAALLVGAVGPLLLTPVVLWLDLRTHGPLPAGVETVFMYVWPTSSVLVAAAGTTPLSGRYLAALFQAALANILVFGVLGAIAGAGYAGLRRFSTRSSKRRP
jgi:hypothetical protein